jgi:hypothetical protein
VSLFYSFADVPFSPPLRLVGLGVARPPENHFPLLFRDQLEAEGPDWDYAAFLSRDLEQYLRDSAEFMAEAWPDDGAA